MRPDGSSGPNQDFVCLSRIFEREEFRSYLPFGSFVLTLEAGVFGVDNNMVCKPEMRELLESQIGFSAANEFECYLDLNKYWVEKIEICRWTTGFAVLSKGNGTDSPLRSAVTRLRFEGERRWRKKVEKDAKSFLSTCNSKTAACEKVIASASFLLGPKTSSHVYETKSTNSLEGQKTPIELISANNSLCAPIVHPTPSHVGFVIDTGRTLYEPDLRSPRHPDAHFLFVQKEERTRTASTFYMFLGEHSCGAFQSLSDEDHAFARPDRQALERIVTDLAATIIRLKAAGSRAFPNKSWPDGIITVSSKMRQEIDRVHHVRKTKAAVLIEGESGTGKELIARAIHNGGPRADQKFVAVNCAAFPDALLDSLLFGIEKGVATGVDARIGKIEQAHNGTLFLDEIADLSPTGQAKLLRAIQEHEFERVGGLEPIVVDVRIIAATHKNLREEIAAGKFREDLYFRLNVVTINLPPLRARLEDIVPLSEHMIAKYAAEQGKQIRPQLCKQVLERLMAYSWPGNVRELQNVIEGGVVVCQGSTIALGDLRLGGEGHSSDPSSLLNLPFDSAVASFEKMYFTHLLRKAGNNRSRASRIAKLDRSVFYRHLVKVGLTEKSEVLHYENQDLTDNSGDLRPIERIAPIKSVNV